MRCIALLAAALLALPAQALLTRGDRDDAEYLELATRYPSALRVSNAGEGVLIAPRWLLTSAQVAQTLQSGDRSRPVVEVAGREYRAQLFIAHPEWKAGSDSDLALVLLAEPVTGIEPTAIYRENDEADEAVRIVAHGETVSIEGTSRKADGRKRAAINTVDRVDAKTFSVAVKSGEDASDLQGAPLASERGAPAFVEIRGSILVAGLFSTSEGNLKTFVRVSSFARWIDTTMYRVAVEEAAATTPRR